jgi:Cu+-exporting ATPase
MVEKQLDPVCGMEVTEEEAACSYEFKGRKYFFCADACRDEFVAHPDRFVPGRA